MSKYRFRMDVVVDTRSAEEALQAVSTHISTVSRQIASGLDGDVVAPEFDIQNVADDTEATDLTDKVSKRDGPIELQLDPDSYAGKLHAVQIEERAKAEAAATPDHRPDHEILAEYSVAEQAKIAEADAAKT